MGVRFQLSALPPAKKTGGQIDKETLKKRITNIEQGIMNVEVRYSIDFRIMTERSDSTLRHSTFLVLPFDFYEVSYEVSGNGSAEH
jgi:hypothetical protein